MTKLYMFHPLSKKAVPLDSAMIALRDKIAAEKGYVHRPCSLASNPVATAHLCWERDDVPAVHQVVRRDLSRRTILFWPRDVDLAALAIDGGHQKRQVVAAAPAPAWPSWRDVRHEVPAEDGKYFVFMRIGVGIPFRHICDWRSGEFLTIWTVTHWMPLPAPPEH